MSHLSRVFLTIMFAAMLLSYANAEVSPASIEKRETELNGLIKESVGQKEMRPEATMQLQNPSTSSLAQPTVSTLAQPCEPLTMAGILDIIKTTANAITPDKN